MSAKAAQNVVVDAEALGMIEGRDEYLFTGTTPEESHSAHCGCSWIACNESENELVLTAMTFGSYAGSRTAELFVREFPDYNDAKTALIEGLKRHSHEWRSLGSATTPTNNVSTPLRFSEPVILLPGAVCGFMLHSQIDGVRYASNGSVQSAGLKLIAARGTDQGNIWVCWNGAKNLPAGIMVFYIDSALTKAAS